MMKIIVNTIFHWPSKLDSVMISSRIILSIALP